MPEARDVSRSILPAADVAILFDRNRLRTARELRGFNQVELAREVGGVNPASLSQFETGHARPSAPTLRRLAVALRVPVDFFAAPARPPGDSETEGFFRSLRSTLPRDRRQARAMVELTRELTLQLENIVALPDLDLPRREEPISPEAPTEEIEALAGAVRQRWELPDGPVVNMVRTLERHGIVTTRFRVQLDRVDAFSVPFADRPVVVLGADKGQRDRSRFDAAHELGHLVLHAPEQAGSKVVEKQAHQFAAGFLMPADQTREELPARADWPRLLELKGRWQVSIAALLTRAKTLNVMDERTYVQAYKVMSMRGWRKQEPGDLGEPESPVLLRRAVEVAAQAGVSLDDLLRRSGLPENDIHMILGDREDPRPRVQL